jgi:hypothetical protein
VAERYARKILKAGFWPIPGARHILALDDPHAVGDGLVAGLTAA